MVKRNLAPGGIFRIANVSLPHVIQIIDNFKGAIYVCSYEIRSTDLESLRLGGVRPVFASLTLDALIHHGYWQKVGHSEDNLSQIALPNYKVEVEGSTYVESFRGELLRSATAEESAQLRYRTVVAPIRLDKAIKAFYGLQPWELVFEELKYEYAEQSRSLIGS